MHGLEPVQLAPQLDDPGRERIVDSRQLAQGAERRVVDVDEARVLGARAVGPSDAELEREIGLLDRDPLRFATFLEALLGGLAIAQERRRGLAQIAGGC